jgi:hypothetical protein
VFAPRYIVPEYVPTYDYVPTVAPLVCVPAVQTRLPSCAGFWVRRGKDFCCEGG